MCNYCAAASARAGAKLSVCDHCLSAIMSGSKKSEHTKERGQGRKNKGTVVGKRTRTARDALWTR